MTTKEIRDDRPLEEKAKIVAQGLISMSGYFSKAEICKCLEMLKDPELVFIEEVESQSPLKVQIKNMDNKRFFRFYIPKPMTTTLDNGTITEIPTLEQAKAFFKGYLSWEKIQSRIKE